LVYAVAGSADESDANKALRRLFAALLLHRVFRTTVVIHSEPHEIDFTSAAGAAWVPPVPAVRSLVGGDWISIDEADAWLDRIGAAARLAQATGYPARSAIYQTMMADPAEMLMRRVEDERGAVSITQADLIRKLPFFRTSGLYKEAQS
jgi:hypothetical protein